MSEAKIDAIIEAMRHERYRFAPARRVLIPKKNGKMRPLGLPSWSDKLVGEVVRLLLEAYYEPQFSDHSHGFRKRRGCHTALREIQRTWTGTVWFIEADISDCFGSLDHDIMVKILAEKIHDNRFLRLIGNMLKAGYLEDWQYRETLSGCPQGGLCAAVHNPPCGVPVSDSSLLPSSVKTPDFRNALTSEQIRLSLILARKRSISAVCEISSKQALMSHSSTHSYLLVLKMWISEIASCARRLGRKPYEDGLKSASKIGSSTSFRLAWTTRSATVGIPRRRSFPFAFGIITCRTSTGRNSPDFSEFRIWLRKASTPIPVSMLGRGGLVDPRSLGALVGGHAFPRGHQERRVVDEVVQVTEPTTRFLGRPVVQLGLHPPYREVGRIRIRPVHGAGIHQRIFGHYFLSLSDTLPPFPMYAALPRSEYYGDSAPLRAFGRHRTYPPPITSGRGAAMERTRTVPTFTAVRSTG